MRLRLSMKWLRQARAWDELGVLALFPMLLAQLCLKLASYAPMRIIVQPSKDTKAMPPKTRPPAPSEWATFLDSLFFCRSCNTWRLPNIRPKLSTQLAPRRKRHASTLVSSTAVNSTRPIPDRYKSLHKALDAVTQQASAHVNLSRLRLALQGLEAERPTTRVAILGLDVETTARKVVRLLLADALEKEGRWERQLLKSELDYTNGVLIRYGQPSNSSLPQPTNAIPTIYIPSSVLQRNDIEILISAVDGSTSEGDSRSSAPPSTPDAFLCPTVGTPTDASGRSTWISLPVHKALLVGSNLDDILQIAKLLALTGSNSASYSRMIDVMLNLPANSQLPAGKIILVDIQAAEEGLSAVRSSLSQATTYEEKWLGSGMPNLSTWLTKASATANITSSKLPGPIKDLVSSLLMTAGADIEVQSASTADAMKQRSMSSLTKASLEEAVGEFSRSAHRELQNGLASAWSSRNWRKLAWYKLFWRVDDVGLIITDLVASSWLPRSERSVYELSGRLEQVGISPYAPTPGTIPLEPALEPGNILRSSPITAFQPQLEIAGADAVLINKSGNVRLELEERAGPPALAATISTSRQSYMVRAIDELTHVAQQLVLRTYGIIGLTSGLSGLAYFSITTGSIYEAGTIVALGTAYALRRMQTDWQRQCKMLEDGLMDTGRTVLRDVEQQVRTLIEEGSQPRDDEVAAKAIADAKTVVVKAQEELNKLV